MFIDYVNFIFGTAPGAKTSTVDGIIVDRAETIIGTIDGRIKASSTQSVGILGTIKAVTTPPGGGGGGMTFGAFEIFVTDMDLPKLDEAWTKVDLGSSSYMFRRSANTSKSFAISGYIQKDTFDHTYVEAKGLNDALNINPAGVFHDGYGNDWNCYVESWDIKPTPGVNKWTFSMGLRLVEDA
jgi:hypothetical protein